MFRVTVHPGLQSRACALYEDPTGPSELWYLVVTVVGTAPSDYPIVPVLHNESDPSNRNVATVHLIHVLNGKKDKRYSAVRGKVVVKASPANLEEWQQDKRLAMYVMAEFSDKPMQNLGCSIGGNDNPASTTISCTCEDESGARTACVPPDGGDCCVGTTESTKTLELDLEPSRCAAMCFAAGPGLLRHCQALL